MSEPNSRLATLRRVTRDAHARIETVPALQRLLADDLTRAEYVTILQHMHAFHLQTEPAIAAELETVPEALSLLDGARLRALADDLAWFGAAPIAPPAWPAPCGPAAALGALYVIEGSGLGARVIARHLADSLGVSPGHGGSFYCGQSAEGARTRWHRLCAVLEQPITAGADDDVADCARETFRMLDRWLRSIACAARSDHDVVAAVAP